MEEKVEVWVDNEWQDMEFKYIKYGDVIRMKPEVSPKNICYFCWCSPVKKDSKYIVFVSRLSSILSLTNEMVC